ncbi:MAG: hypothetical protein KDB27_34835, partial [Planctomycetales bacterium]|nr:hypothetical protein [Planctomycetales bacterium]
AFTRAVKIENLGMGIFFNLLLFHGVGLFELDEPSTPELAAIAGLCRAVPQFQFELAKEAGFNGRKPKSMVIAFQAGLTVQVAMHDPRFPLLLGVDWSDVAATSHRVGASKELLSCLVDIVDKTNRMVAEVPRLAEAIGKINVKQLLKRGSDPGYMHEAIANWQDWVLTQELLWPVIEVSNLPLLGVFDPLARLPIPEVFEFKRNDSDDPDDDEPMAAAVAA